MPPPWKAIQQELNGTILKEEKDWGATIFFIFIVLFLFCILSTIMYHLFTLEKRGFPLVSIVQCKDTQDLTTCIVVDEQGLMYKLSHITMKVNQ